VTVPEAVWAYTMGPAVACGLEYEMGSVTKGKVADMIVLDQDIFSIDPMTIHTVKVDLTIFDGRVVYQR
jgi:predicted amidohydrolase YtcJ